jgi:hypothetical protein
MISVFCYDGFEAKRSSDVHPRRDYDGRSDRWSSSRAEAGRGNARGIEGAEEMNAASISSQRKQQRQR